MPRKVAGLDVGPFCTFAAHALASIKVQKLAIEEIRMGAVEHNETMRRKPILMPPSMINKVKQIAKRKKVSFAQVVREAVDAFGGEAETGDELILEVLADKMIQTTNNLIVRMDEIEKRLDNTHTFLVKVKE